MIAKKPGDRYQTAEDAKRDLEKVLDGISTIHELPSIQEFKETLDAQSKDTVNSSQSDDEFAANQAEEERQKKIIIGAMLFSVAVVLFLVLSSR